MKLESVIKPGGKYEGCANEMHLGIVLGKRVNAVKNCPYEQ
jgi:hypothetical protein